MPDEDEGAEPNPDTVRLIFEHIQHAPERQLGDNNDLDAKVASLFGVASVIMGLASFGRLGAGTTGTTATVITGLLMAATAAYVGVAFAALKHLKPVEQDRVVFASTIWDRFKNKSPYELEEWLVSKTKDAWERNVLVTKNKGDALRWVVKGLAAEVVLVAAALIASRF